MVSESEGQETSNAAAGCCGYLFRHHASIVGRALDLIELTFRFADGHVRNMDQYERQQLELVHPDEAIEELKGRFREHGIGYEYAGGEIITS